MKEKIKEFEDISNYCNSKKHFQIYDYLYYVGITNVVDEISDKDLIDLINICKSVDSDFRDPIGFAQALALEVFEEENISINDLKNVPSNDLYDMFFNGELDCLKSYSKEQNFKEEQEYEL